VAVTGVASAQVTLSGTYNLDVQNSPTVKGASVGAGDAILSFSAAEDLGGGMKLNMNTTIQAAAGRSGAATGNGHSLSVSGGFGTIGLQNYLVGSALLSAGVSADNDMNDVMGGYVNRNRAYYSLPAVVPGLSVKLAMDSSGASTTTGAANRAFLDTSVQSRPKLFVGYTMGAASVDYSSYPGGTYDYALSYDAGIAKVAYAADGVAQKEWTITAPVGSTLAVGLHNAKNATTSANGLVATYTMSKRTKLSYNYVNQKLTGTNYRMRLSHSF